MTVNVQYKYEAGILEDLNRTAVGGKKMDAEKYKRLYDHLLKDINIDSNSETKNLNSFLPHY